MLSTPKRLPLVSHSTFLCSWSYRLVENNVLVTVPLRSDGPIALHSTGCCSRNDNTMRARKRKSRHTRLPLSFAATVCRSRSIDTQVFSSKDLVWEAMGLKLKAHVEALADASCRVETTSDEQVRSACLFYVLFLLSGLFPKRL